MTGYIVGVMVGMFSTLIVLFSGLYSDLDDRQKEEFQRAVTAVAIVVAAGIVLAIAGVGMFK